MLFLTFVTSLVAVSFNEVSGSKEMLLLADTSEEQKMWIQRLDRKIKKKGYKSATSGCSLLLICMCLCLLLHPNQDVSSFLQCRRIRESSSYQALRKFQSTSGQHVEAQVSNIASRK